MKLNFSKYHGAGNDFIMVDNREVAFIPETGLIAALCDRRFGIGADGLILLNRAEGYDFGMRYYNADGIESTMCGNGGRCITAFADSLSHSKDHYRFLAIDGEHNSLILSRKNDSFLVKLGMTDVLTITEKNQDFVLNTGSPHYVRFVPDVLKINVVTEGRLVRYNDENRHEGINVNFVQEKEDKIIVRTYERGVEDETLSCGTGVTASALAYVFRNKMNQGVIPIITRGGNLAVHFVRSLDGFTNIYLEGPVQKVFTGVADLNEMIKSQSDYLINQKI